MVTRLKSLKSYDLPSSVINILNGYTYVFNPSYIYWDKVNYLAVRVYDSENKAKSIKALILIWENNELIKQIDLLSFFQKTLKISKVADPKLFLMNGKVFGTFNTSHAVKKPNNLVMFELNKTSFKDYFFCHYEKRSRTEKNWAFFLKNSELYALYSLSPFTIIKARNREFNKVVFEKHYSNQKLNYKNYSIGTPLIELNKNFGFIAHRKIMIKGKLIYLGKPCKLEINNEFNLFVNRKILFHSLRSLFGNKFKFNKNLISCSYFSGISKVGEGLVIGYGINDLKWNLVKLKPRKLWS